MDIKQLREKIKSIETDTYSASHEIGDNDKLIDVMIELLIDKFIQGDFAYTMHDLEYDARLIIDPTHGSDEF